MENIPLFTFQNISSILQSKPIDFTNNKLCTNSSRRFGECDENGEVFSYVPLVLIFMSQFVLGIGNTLYYSLGQSYLDDNTKQRNTPLMLGYAFSMRMFGPMLGFGLSYFVLNIYIDPRYTPIITRDVSFFPKSNFYAFEFNIDIVILPGSALVGSLLAWMEYSGRIDVRICWFSWIIPEKFTKEEKGR